MSENVEKAIDISKYKLGETVKGINCPRCKKKNEMRLIGIHHKLYKSHEVECYQCFLTERVNPKNVEFVYEPPKEPKKKKGEVGD